MHVYLDLQLIFTTKMPSESFTSTTMTLLTFLALCACVALTIAGTSGKAGPRVATTKSDWEGWQKPSFCRENDCPVYDVVEKFQNYELRSYRAAQWVSTTVESLDYGSESSNMFYKLFRYISGANDREEEIEMTTPVMTRVVPGSGPNCKSTFTRSFYIEWDKQGTTPAPTETDVFIENRQVMNVYVMSFSGFASMDDYLQKVVELGNTIGDISKFETGVWYRVGYSGRFVPFDRHNEVWLVAKN